jgi:hypothetical protein
MLKNEGIVPPFMTSVLDGGEWPLSSPSPFTPGKTIPGTHWIGGWVHLRARLDFMEARKILSLSGMGATLPPIQWDTTGAFYQGESDVTMKLITHLHLVWRLRICGAIRLISYKFLVFDVRAGTTLLLLFMKWLATGRKTERLELSPR